MPEEVDIPSNFNVADFLVASAVCADYGSSTANDEGALRFECEVSHLGYNDPIVYPNIKGASHLHHFFGNTAVDHTSTYHSLRTSGDGTCAGGPINRTGYWFPAMIRPQNNKIVKPDFITVYYKSNRREQVQYASPHSSWVQNAAIKLPRGLRYIFGWKHSDEDTPISVWGCEDGSSTTQDHIADVAAIGCPSNFRLYARLAGPQCWDGVNLDSPDHRSHMAYMQDDGSGFGIVMCPPTHPQPLPHYEVIIWWSHNGPSDFSQWYISSDTHDGENWPGGHTFHTDWYGAWDTTVSDRWAEENDGIGGGQPEIRNGVGGQICGSASLFGFSAPMALDSTGNTLGPTPESERYLDIPANNYPESTGRIAAAIANKSGRPIARGRWR